MKLKSNVEEFICRFETGKCKHEEDIFAGFQMLLNEGVLFEIEDHNGFYGRMGKQMLERGFIHLPKDAVVLDADGHEIKVGQVN